jgi:hypothetical protein
MDRSVPVADGITRRGLLASGATAAAALAVAGSVRVASSRASPPVGVLALRRSTFAPLVGQRFRLRTTAGQTAPARLAAVRDYGDGRLFDRIGSDLAFVLLFHTPPGATRLDQDVMTVEHDAIGSVGLLVSPAGTGRRGQDYTAVIDTAVFTGSRGD